MGLKQNTRNIYHKQMNNGVGKYALFLPWLEYPEAGGVCRCGQEGDDDGGGRGGPSRHLRHPHVGVLVLGAIGRLSGGERLQSPLTLPQTDERTDGRSLSLRSYSRIPICGVKLPPLGPCTNDVN